MPITPRARSPRRKRGEVGEHAARLERAGRWKSSALRKTRAPASSLSVAERERRRAVAADRRSPRARPRRRRASSTTGDCKRVRSYVSVYSGPEPPSGGVSRPPLAVIAPHWTQFDGVTSTCDLAVAGVVADLVDLRRAHPRPRARRSRAARASLHADVVRRVVAGLVAARKTRRELVEGELAVGSRVALRAVGADQLLLGVALEARVAAAGSGRGWPSSRRPARRRARSRGRTPAACCAPASGRSRRSSRASASS